MKTYQIHVFGKPGCAKCHTLQGRLDDLLQEEEWSDFEKVYHDLETEDGLVAFCEAECLNPQRVPAFYVAKDGAPLANPAPGESDAVLGHSALYTLVGLETDYSPTGRGVLTPKMIEATLRRAKAL